MQVLTTFTEGLEQKVAKHTKKRRRQQPRLCMFFLFVTFVTFRKASSVTLSLRGR